MKREIDAFEHAGEILAALPRGLLLTTSAGGRTNSMVIGWGTLGIEWKKRVFVAYVRESRFTHELLDKNPEFTINVPTGDIDPKIMSICGTKSGRDIDKIAECGLTLEDPLAISVPAIRELPLTLECRAVFRAPQPASRMSGVDLDMLYPQSAPNRFVDANRDLHTAFYGEIAASYIIE